MAHDLDADVACVFVGEQGVEVIDDPRENGAQQRQGELSRHQPPEAGRNRLMMRHHVDDGIDDELADGQQRYRQQRDQYANGDSERDHQRTGFPDDLEHRRYLAQRRQPLLPATPETFRAFRHAGFLTIKITALAGSSHPKLACGYAFVKAKGPA